MKRYALIAIAVAVELPEEPAAQARMLQKLNTYDIRCGVREVMFEAGAEEVSVELQFEPTLRADEFPAHLVTSMIMEL